MTTRLGGGYTRAARGVNDFAARVRAGPGLPCLVAPRRRRRGRDPFEIRVDVYNTAINRLAEGGRLPDMKRVVERYGQRTRLQDLDGLQPLPSGLLSPPRLVAER